MKKQLITLVFSLGLSATLYAQQSLRIEAENFTEKSEKVSINKKKTGETIVGGFDKGQWIKLESVDFGEDTGKITVRTASGAKSGKAFLEIRLGAENGEVIGKIKLPIEGWNTYTEASTHLLKKISGKNTIYVLSLNGGVILDWIELGK